MSQNIGTLVTAPIRPNDSNDKIETSWANEAKGGHHSYQTLSERDAIIEVRREWAMFCSVADTKTTYQLQKGYASTSIIDNLNWVVFSSAAVGSVPGLELWVLENTPYDKDVFVGHVDIIWQSTIDNNEIEPGSIDPNTGLTHTAWKEATKDSLSHLQNTDSGTDKPGFNLGKSITTGIARFIKALGISTNIDLEFWPKGSGKIKFIGSAYNATEERLLAINANKEIIIDNVKIPLFVAPPASLPTYPGKKGQEAYDNSYYYVCIEDNTWVRYSLGNRDYLTFVTAPPATLTSAGSQGQIAFDANYRYECYAPNNWYRFPHNKDLIQMYVGVPLTLTSPGIQGQMSADENFLYYCVATSTWCKVTRLNNRILYIGSDATGNKSTVQADGTDANIDLALKVKGSGHVTLEGAAYVVTSARVLVMNAQGKITSTYELNDIYVAPPPTLTSPGFKGQRSWDGSFLYECVEDNFWIKFLPESAALQFLQMYVAVPATLTSPGAQGEKAYDMANNLMYECIAINTWIRYSTLPANVTYAEKYVALPATPTSSGLQGQRAYDSVNNLMYECVSNNIWVRYVTVGTW